MLLNHRIGTIRPKVGYTQYYLSLTPGAWKTFNTEDQTFWCCTGSGIEEYSKLNDSIYWRDEDGLYVNLFIPSELDWAEKGFKLRQETRYPESQDATLTCDRGKAGQRCRHASAHSRLAAVGAAVKLNGKVLDASAAPGSYLTLTRVSGRPAIEVEMRLPMHLHVEAMPDDPQHAGVSVWTAGSGRRSRRGGADRSPHHRTELAGRARRFPSSTARRSGR